MESRSTSRERRARKRCDPHPQCHGKRGAHLSNKGRTRTRPCYWRNWWPALWVQTGAGKGRKEIRKQDGLSRGKAQAAVTTSSGEIMPTGKQPDGQSSGVQTGAGKGRTLGGNGGQPSGTQTGVGTGRTLDTPPMDGQPAGTQTGVGRGRTLEKEDKEKRVMCKVTDDQYAGSQTEAGKGGNEVLENIGQRTGKAPAVDSTKVGEEAPMGVEFGGQPSGAQTGAGKGRTSGVIADGQPPVKYTGWKFVVERVSEEEENARKARWCLN
ncbi:hypothetical protein K7X08_019858 [Anisodus acutangulus]|uniref:Uncharacterized protein n=1 Tax=Anisodus acutangulus TaxID=402998 RepID=A0A9Q1MSA4_9SOLA|nr:hypothetical protein K7X08_019858 [Anisodus acutangulus]